MPRYVNVINCRMSGTFSFEGRARVVETLEGGEMLVDFEDGYGPVERFIDKNMLDPKINIAGYIDKLNSE